MRRSSRFLGILLMSLFSLSPAHSFPNRLVGKAYDLSTNEHAFTMIAEFVRDIRGHAATRITYADPTGKVFAREEIDFRKDRVAPGYSFHDLRNNQIAGAEVVDDGVKLYEGRKNGDLRRSVIQVPAPAVISAGLDHYIKDNWKNLVAGKTLQFQQVVPTEFNHFTFTIKKTAEKEIEGRKFVDFRMQVQNFVYRMVVDPIVFRYDVDARQMTSFEGMYHLTDNKGNRFKVRMTFQEDPLSMGTTVPEDTIMSEIRDSAPAS